MSHVTFVLLFLDFTHAIDLQRAAAGQASGEIAKANKTHSLCHLGAYSVWGKIVISGICTKECLGALKSTVSKEHKAKKVDLDPGVRVKAQGEPSQGKQCLHGELK